MRNYPRRNNSKTRNSCKCVIIIVGIIPKPEQLQMRNYARRNNSLTRNSRKCVAQCQGSRSPSVQGSPLPRSFNAPPNTRAFTQHRPHWYCNIIMPLSPPVTATGTPIIWENNICLTWFTCMYLNFQNMWTTHLDVYSFCSEKHIIYLFVFALYIYAFIHAFIYLSIHSIIYAYYIW